MFVRDLDNGSVNDYAVVKSITEMGQLMGKRVIVEFVKNQIIVDKLRQIGVDYAQGFYVGEPMLLTKV